jgi:hypothetical protein
MASVFYLFYGPRDPKWMDDTTASQYLDSHVCLLREVGLRYLLSNIKKRYYKTLTVLEKAS